MARGKKNIEGQLSFDFSLNSNNYVCFPIKYFN